MILGAYIIIHSIGIGFGTVEEPGPGFFPLFGGLLIMIFDITIMLQKSKDIDPLFKNNHEVITFFSIAISFILWIIIMPYLGYVVVTFIFLIVLFKVLRLEGWLKPLILATGITIFIYLLFDYWLYTDLPRGILG